MKFYDADQINESCNFPELVEALKRYHLEDTEVMEDLLLSQPSASGTDVGFFIRAAWQGGHALGAKLVTLFWDNPGLSEGLPAVQGVFIVFDGTNGMPMAVLDGTALTHWKTAADSALGSQYLSRHDVSTMVAVGAGALTPYLIGAHCAIRPAIQRVLIWNRTRARAEAVAARLAIEGVSIEVADELEPAVRGADLITSATATRDPLIRGEWLSPGTHLDLVGAFTPDMREADDEALQRASIFVDARATTIKEIGELKIPLATGIISKSDVLADHYDLARGQHPGRREDDEITLFKNGGGGHLDLMTARFVLAQGSG